MNIKEENIVNMIFMCSMLLAVLDVVSLSLVSDCYTLVKMFFIRRLFNSFSGRVIKALSNSWHPDCLTCQICQNSLTDQGFIKTNGKLYQQYFLYLLDF